jgi:spermidine synthase
VAGRRTGTTRSERSTQTGSASRTAYAARHTTAPVGGGTAELVPDRERARGWSLLIDGAPQSYVDLDDPEYLDFSYQRRIGHLVDLAAPPGRPLHVVHLGGGALALARYVAATRPRSTQQVVEVDRALTDFVRQELPWDRNWRIRVRGADARAGLAKVPDGWADLVIADVFGGARTPAHLTSTEFVAEAHRALTAGGLYAANVADGAPLAFLRSQVSTVRSVFARACLAADPAVLRGRRFGNAVLIAADRELPVAEFTRRVASDPHPGRVEYGRPLDDLTGGAAPVTDATAVDSPAPPASAFE